MQWAPRMGRQTGTQAYLPALVPPPDSEQGMCLCSLGASGADDAFFRSRSSGRRDLATAFPLGIANVSHAGHGPTSPPPRASATHCWYPLRSADVPQAAQLAKLTLSGLPPSLASGTPPPAHPQGCLLASPECHCLVARHSPNAPWHGTQPLPEPPAPPVPPAPSPGRSRCAHSPLLFPPSVLPQAHQPLPPADPAGNPNLLLLLSLNCSSEESSPGWACLRALLLSGVISMRAAPSMSLLTVSPAPETARYRAGAQEPCERVPRVGRARAHLATALRALSMLCVTLVTPSQDSYSYGPSTDAGSYGSFENRQYHLPAASPPQLPASATACQPGASPQGATGFTMGGAPAKSQLKLSRSVGGPGTSGLSSPICLEGSAGVGLV